MTTILVDGHIVNSSGEGIRSYIIGLYNELSMSPDVRVVLAVVDIDDAQKYFSQDIEFVRLKSRNKWVRLLWEIPRISFVLKPDFVHFQYISSPVVRGKKIVTLHDVLFIRFWREYPLRLVIFRAVAFFYSARTADILITDSNYSKSEIALWFRINPIKIHNLPLGVNFTTNDVGSPAIKEHSPYILYVSRIERRKNHHSLINAYFESDIHAQLKLVFVGRGALKYPELQNCLNNLTEEQKKRISFLQNLSTEDLANMYRNASLFVFPSLSEGFGIPPLEAAFFGVPVICSNTTSLIEYSFFQDEHINTLNTGLIIDRLNHFSQFGRVSYDLDKVKGIVSNKYSWSRYVTDFMELIKDNPNSKS